jgi:REP element-mobilizing transposase RayT
VRYDLAVAHTNLVYHLVYGTKDRLPLITKELRPRLHRYLGGLVKGLHGTPLEINGTFDHVHVLARIKPVISIAEFMSKFKSTSSGWANRQTRGKFKWQVKYGAFKLSQSQVQRVQRYIENQEAHHSKTTFEEEFRLLLKNNGIEFDERYLWE